jgi:hypothetical protein
MKSSPVKFAGANQQATSLRSYVQGCVSVAPALAAKGGLLSRGGLVSQSWAWKYWGATEVFAMVDGVEGGLLLSGRRR